MHYSVPQNITQYYSILQSTHFMHFYPFTILPFLPFYPFYRFTLLPFYRFYPFTVFTVFTLLPFYRAPGGPRPFTVLPFYPFTVFTLLPFLPFLPFYSFTVLPFYRAPGGPRPFTVLPFYPFTPRLVSENHRKQKAPREPPQLISLNQNFSQLFQDLNEKSAGSDLHHHHHHQHHLPTGVPGPTSQRHEVRDLRSPPQGIQVETLRLRWGYWR